MGQASLETDPLPEGASHAATGRHVMPRRGVCEALGLWRVTAGPVSQLESH